MIWIYILITILAQANYLEFSWFYSSDYGASGSVIMFDSAGSQLYLNDIPIYLYLKPSSSLSSSGWKNYAYSGIASFYLGIWCLGTYQVVAHSPGFEDALTSSFTTYSDYCDEITISIAIVPSTDLYEITLETRASYQDTLINCNYKIEEIDNNTFSGISSQNGMSSNSPFYLSFSGFGIKKFIGVCNNINSKYFEVEVLDFTGGYISSTFISNIPSVISSNFSILVQVFQDQDLTIKMTEGSYLIYLLLTPVVNFTTVSGYTNNGEITFENLNTIISGLFCVVSYAEGMHSSFSQQFYLNQIDVKFEIIGETPHHLNQTFSMTLSIWANQIFIQEGSYKLDILTDPEINWTGEKQVVTSNGVYTITNITINEIEGFCFFTNIYGYASQSDFIMILPYYKLYIPNPIIYANTIFSIQLLPYTDALLTETYTGNGFFLVIYLDPVDFFLCFSWPWYFRSMSACNYASISNPGEYRVKIMVNDYIMLTDSFKVNIFALPYFITLPKNPSEVLDFYLTLSCDEDSIYLYGNLPLTLNVTISNESKETMISKTTQDGIASFQLDPIEDLAKSILKIEGDFIFTYFTTIYIRAYLDIEMMSNLVRFIQLKNSENQIKLKIGVYKDQQLTMKMPANNCDVLLRLEPQGDISDWTCFVKNDGYMYITDLYVLSSGTFKIIAYNDEFYYNASTSMFTISFISKVFAIKLSTQYAEIISDQYFIVQVEIFKKNKEAYTDPTMIYLNCTESICNGETAKQNNNGKANFNISISNIGKADITAYTDNDSLAQRKEFLSVSILDPLCIMLDQNNSCIECTENARNIEGVCLCGEFSDLSTDKRKCECHNSYLSYDNACKACNKYIVSEDIFSYYTENYKGIIVHFLKFPIISKMPCLFFFHFPYNDQSDFACYKVDGSTFLIQSNHYIPQMTVPITITEPIVSYEASCMFFDETAQFVPNCIYPLPTPFIDLVYPYTISLTCSSSKAYFSTLIIDPDYVYSWNATIYPRNLDLENYLLMQNTSEIYIEKKFLSQGSLEIELKVTSIMFNTFTIESAVVEITDEARIQVDFNTGDEIYMKSSDSFNVRAQVSNRCGLAGSVYYSWSLISPNFTELELFYSGSETDSLKIIGGYLKPGITYVFEVTVQAGSKIASSKRLTIYCLYDELSLKLSRWNGTVGLDDDFEVAAEAKDINDANADIEIEWICLENDILCKGKDGNALFNSYKGALLIIPKEKLRNGAIYILNCTASTPLKSKSLIISITFDSSSTGSLIIITPESSIISQSPIILYSILTSSIQSPIIWSSFNEFPLLVSSFENKSYLKILPEFLQPGKTYQISASVDSANLISFISISRKKLPECLGFTAKYSNQKWALKVQNCTSENGNLLYQYGFAYENDTVFITEMLYKDSVSLFGKTSVLQAVVQVCDKYGCIVYYADLPQRNRKLLEEIDFEQELSLADSIPDTLIFYFQNTGASLFPTIFSAFINYYSSGVSTKSEFLTYVACFEELMKNHMFLTTMQADNVLNQLISIIISTGISIDNPTANLLIKTISVVVNKVEVQIFIDTLQKINQYSLLDMFPGDKNLFFQDIFLYNLRVFNTSKIEVYEENLMIDVNAELDENYVYDFSFAKFELADLSLVVSFKLEILGTYDDYRNVKNFQRLDEYVKSVTVSFKQKNHFGDERFKCFSYDNDFWNSSYCNVAVDRDGKLMLAYQKTSNIKIKWYPIYGCKESLFIPVLLMILTPLCCFVAIVFLIHDWKSSKEIFKSLQIISLASLAINQSYSKRAFTVLHLLGIFCCTVSSLESFNQLFLFEIEIESISIFPSLATLLIINLFAIFFLYIKVQLFMIRLWRIIGFSLILLITIATIAVSCVLSDGMCDEKQKKWILISAILFTFHTIVLESFYGGIAQMFSQNVENKKRRVDDSAERVVLDQPSEKDGCKSLEEEKTEEKRG